MLLVAPRFRGDPGRDTLAVFSFARLAPLRGLAAALPSVQRSSGIVKGHRTRGQARAPQSCLDLRATELVGVAAYGWHRETGSRFAAHSVPIPGGQRFCALWGSAA